MGLWRMRLGQGVAWNPGSKKSDWLGSRLDRVRPRAERMYQCSFMHYYFTCYVRNHVSQLLVTGGQLEFQYQLPSVVEGNDWQVCQHILVPVERLDL